MFHQHGQTVTCSDGLLQLGLLQQGRTDGYHRTRITLRCLSCTEELLDQHHPVLDRAGHVRRSAGSVLGEIFQSHVHCISSLGVVTVLVNLHLTTTVVEGSQLHERLGLGVKSCNGFENVNTFAPVHLLQVVGSQLVDLGITGNRGELNHRLGVARAHEALDGSNPVARLGVLLTGQLEAALLLQGLGEVAQYVAALAGLEGLWWGKGRHHHVIDVHLVLETHLDSRAIALGHHIQLNRSLVLLVLHQELGASSQCLRGTVRTQVLCDGVEHVIDQGIVCIAGVLARAETQIQCTGNVATLVVELHGLVELPALFEMHGTLNHQRRRGLEGISHEFGVEVVGSGQADAVVVAATARIERNRIIVLTLVLELSGEVVSRCTIIGLRHDLCSLVEVTLEAGDADKAEVVSSLAVVLLRLVIAFDALQIGRPPLQQHGIITLQHKIPQFIHAIELKQHAGYLGVAVATQAIVLNRVINQAQGLQVARVLVMRGL
mmetsp:Transcript_15814/g.27807  ORF Transcript_15814/g.27807 Transcript_15814/m.27807 type:complete len:491 (-) Transcript_15814:3070-4542(-)